MRISSGYRRRWRQPALTPDHWPYTWRQEQTTEAKGDSIVAVTREQVLHAMADVALDAQGTKLIDSGRLSDVIVDAERARHVFDLYRPA